MKKDILDIFSEVVSKYVNFYMTEEEFNKAWIKVTKEMSRRYKKRGKELCSSKEEINEVIEWFYIGKTKREIKLEEKIKEFEEKINEYEFEENRLKTKIKNLEYELSLKTSTLEKDAHAKLELEKRVSRIEKKIREHESKEYEEVAKANRKFREYEEWANSIEGISEWGDYVRDIVECEARERKAMEDLERLF